MDADAVPATLTPYIEPGLVAWVLDIDVNGDGVGTGDLVSTVTARVDLAAGTQTAIPSSSASTWSSGPPNPTVSPEPSGSPDPTDSPRPHRPRVASCAVSQSTTAWVAAAESPRTSTCLRWAAGICVNASPSTSRWSAALLAPALPRPQLHGEQLAGVVAGHQDQMEPERVLVGGAIPEPEDPPEAPQQRPGNCLER